MRDEDNTTPGPVDDVLKDLTHVGPLYLDDAMGRWVFEPRADITALEASLIMVLFVHTLNLRKRLGWREYLTRDHKVFSYLPSQHKGQPATSEIQTVTTPNLARHFRPVED